MLDVLCKAWGDAIDDVARVWDSEVRAGRVPAALDIEDEHAIEEDFDKRAGDGDLPGALLAIEEWRARWLRTIDAAEGVVANVDQEGL